MKAMIDEQTKIIQETINFKSAFQFKEGAYNSKPTDLQQYSIYWTNFISYAVAFPTKIHFIIDTFLDCIPWNLLTYPLFSNAVQRALSSQINKVWDWFTKYFEPVTIDIPTKEDFTQFIEFIDVCEKSHITNLCDPFISSYNEGIGRLQKCIIALTYSSNKQIQAQFLNNLPEKWLITKALQELKFPIVIQQMVLHNDIQNHSIEEISSTFDYCNYIPKAINYLCRIKNLDIPSIVDFFHELSILPCHKLINDEKILISRIFTTCCAKYPNNGNGKAMILRLLELKKLSSSFFYSIIKNEPVESDAKVSNYILLCEEISKIDSNQYIINKAVNNVSKYKIQEAIKIIKESNISSAPPENAQSISALIERYSTSNEFVKFPLSKEDIAILEKEYTTLISVEKEYCLKGKTADQVIEDFKATGKSIASSKTQRNDCIKILALLRITVKNIFKILPYDTQIFAILALTNNGQSKGKIAQIRTGEGKSIIISMLAAFFAIQGKCVDVITSSHYLAIRDQRKFAEFFSTLGITSSHICYEHPTKDCFNGIILYGTNYDFEFAILRDKLYRLHLKQTEINGKLMNRPCDVAIVDEIDNLLLDAALNSARLAISNPCSNSWVYEPILEYAKTINREKGQINAAESIRNILNIYKNGEYKKQVQGFTDEQLIRWHKSSITALEMKQNKEYIIRQEKKQMANGDVLIPKVIIVDYKNTGRLNPGSRWSNGLHEFVEVKHGLPPEEESFTAASISHPSFFQYYAHIFGLTGTIGDTTERDEIFQIYQIHSFDAPPHKQSMRKRLTPISSQTESDHQKCIVKDISDMANCGRSLLILFDTIQKSTDFYNYLKSAHPQLKVQLLNETQKEDEDYIVAMAGKPKIVTIATNTAGRGTDIVLTDSCKRAGGLHVVITFYPSNIRVEDQGLGRAGRQGQPGSCRIIICSDNDISRTLLPDADLCLLGKSSKFIEGLNKLRSLSNTLESENRIAQSHIEIIQHNSLTLFFDFLDLYEERAIGVNITEIANSLKTVSQINDKEPYDENGRLKNLQRQYEEMVKQGKIDYKRLIENAQNNLIEIITLKWAAFYDNMIKSNRREDNLFNYQEKINKSLYTFIDKEVAPYLGSIKGGIINVLAKIIKCSPSLLTEQDSPNEIYEIWYRNSENKQLKYKLPDINPKKRQELIMTTIQQRDEILNELTIDIIKITEDDAQKQLLTSSLSSLDSSKSNTQYQSEFIAKVASLLNINENTLLQCSVLPKCLALFMGLTTVQISKYIKCNDESSFIIEMNFYNKEESALFKKSYDAIFPNFIISLTSKDIHTGICRMSKNIFFSGVIDIMMEIYKQSN